MSHSNGASRGLQDLSQQQYEAALERAHALAERAQCMAQQVCESPAAHWTAISGGSALAVWGIQRRGAMGWLAAAAGVGLTSWGLAQRMRDRHFMQSRMVAVPPRRSVTTCDQFTEAEIDDMVEASFPASDPPAYNPGII